MTEDTITLSKEVDIPDMKIKNTDDILEFYKRLGWHGEQLDPTSDKSVPKGKVRLGFQWIRKE
jgi:hypothetical protein